MKTPAHGFLMAQQTALLKALMAPPGQAAEAVTEVLLRLDPDDTLAHRGLQAYQANGHALAERCLRAAYPVIEAMLGSDNFSALARDLWHRHPPARGDLTRWGDALPAFLAGNQALTDTPYLSDVARAEWACHALASVSDAAPDPASFARLSAGDASGLTLTLAPGTTLITSPFPVATLVLAHRFQEPSMADAAQKLREHTAETALIWRERQRPRLSPVSPVEAAMTRSLLQGLDVPAALDAALAAAPDGTDDFDLSRWLTQAVSCGLVTGVCDAPRPSAKAPT